MSYELEYLLINVSDLVIISDFKSRTKQKCLTDAFSDEFNN